MRQRYQELLVFLQCIQGVLVLIYFRTEGLYLRVYLFYFVLFLLANGYHLFSFTFFLLCSDVVLFNELHKFDMVVFELIGGIFQRDGFAFGLMIKFFDFFLDGVVGEFNQEHLFLLIDELVHILRTLFPRELHPRLGYVHCRWDVTALGRVEIVQVLFHLRWLNIGIFYFLERNPRCGSFLVPDLQILALFLRFLPFLLLGLPCNEHFLVVRWSERGVSWQLLRWLLVLVRRSLAQQLGIHYTLIHLFLFSCF